MSEQPMDGWEADLSRIAASFPYPTTPDIAGRISKRLHGAAARPLRFRLAWTLVVLFVLLGSLLAVPPVRAAVLEFLQIGAVRIFLPAPTPTATSLPAAQGMASPAPTDTPTATPRPRPTPTPLHLAGETTLAEAQAQVDFPIRLPTHPPDLGAPDRVFLQDRNGPLLVLVWLQPEPPQQVRLALYQLGPGVQASKGDPPAIAETTVGGKRAVWVEGPHMLQIEGGQYDMVRLVGDNVLVWTRKENGQTITYRLETDLPAEEAVRIAESLEVSLDSSWNQPALTQEEWADLQSYPTTFPAPFWARDEPKVLSRLAFGVLPRERQPGPRVAREICELEAALPEAPLVGVGRSVRPTSPTRRRPSLAMRTATGQGWKPTSASRESTWRTAVSLPAVISTCPEPGSRRMKSGLCRMGRTWC